MSAVSAALLANAAGVWARRFQGKTHKSQRALAQASIGDVSRYRAGRPSTIVIALLTELDKREARLLQRPLHAEAVRSSSASLRYAAATATRRGSL